MRRLALLIAGAAAATLVVPVAPATALGGTVTGSFLCENTFVSSLPTDGTPRTVSTAINAAPQAFTTTVALPDSADAGTGADAQVTIVPASGGTLPLSPPVTLPGVTIQQLQVRLDIYRSTTNKAIDISPTLDMTTGSVAIAVPIATQAPSTPWALPGSLQVTAPVTGAAGQRAWVRVKSFSFTWENSVADWSGSTTCRLAAAAALPGGPTTVEQPIFGALTPLSRQFPVSSTNVNLSGTETQIRAEFADLVTFTGTAPPPTGSSCTVTDPSGCTTGQEITATVTAGTLSQQAAEAASNPSATAIVLTEDDGNATTFSGAAAVTVGTTSQLMEGALNPVTVTDVRGGTAGWSLTAELSGPFTEVGSGEIAESAAKIVQIGCLPAAGSATSNLGAGGTLSSAVTLCGVDPGIDDSDGQSGGGQYTVTGRVELTVPAFQKAGEYSSTLVITLT